MTKKPTKHSTDTGPNQDSGLDAHGAPKTPIAYSKAKVVEARNDEDDWERKGPKGRKARRWALLRLLIRRFT